MKATVHHRHVRRAGSSASVSLHVRDLSQMFNSLDPSPFWDRDLDRDAAAFIEEEFSDKHSAETWHLNVHTRDGSALAGDLQRAVENYYERLANATRRQLADFRRMGEIGLAVGVTVFLFCMGARELVHTLTGDLPRMLDEGLIILAWIALWRPTEVLAYEWIPLTRRRRFYERLAATRVVVRTDPPPE